MASRLAGARDLYAGALVAAVGAGALVESVRYKIGTLNRMGPGFIPVVIGVVLVALGVMIAMSAAPAEDEGEPVGKDLRGGACIVAGVLAFMGLGATLGLAAAIFGCVFVSALGDRKATLRGSALLALGVTVCGSFVFTVLLKIPFPLFGWS